MWLFLQGASDCGFAGAFPGNRARKSEEREGSAKSKAVGLESRVEEEEEEGVDSAGVVAEGCMCNMGLVSPSNSEDAVEAEVVEMFLLSKDPPWILRLLSSTRCSIVRTGPPLCCCCEHDRLNPFSAVARIISLLADAPVALSPCFMARVDRGREPEWIPERIKNPAPR